MRQEWTAFSPCNFRAHTHEDLRTYVHRKKWMCVLPRCKHWSECTQSQGISTDVHGAQGCKCGESVWNWHGAQGWEGGCASVSRACSNSILGFSPSWFRRLFCGRADSMSTGKVLNESNPISRMPYQLWTGLFLTADLSHCTKPTHHKQLTQCWKHKAEGREDSRSL